VRLQWRRLALYLILFPVRKRIHCGIGRFCFATCASFFLMMVVLWDGWRVFFVERKGKERGRGRGERKEIERGDGAIAEELVFSFPAFRNGRSRHRAAFDRKRDPNARPRYSRV